MMITALNIHWAEQRLEELFAAYDVLDNLPALVSEETTSALLIDITELFDAIEAYRTNLAETAEFEDYLIRNPDQR
tara:strand:+ start:211 stop:438 length:228 start_codon:yes stop_codon:yes gene_type:complete